MRRALFIELESEDNGCMAETAIILNGHVLGYVGASKYVSTTEEEAEKAIVNVFRRLLADEPEIKQKSRFGYRYYEDNE